MSTEQRQVVKAQAADIVRSRGTGRTPGVPRDISLQSGPRGILVNWRGPDGFRDDIAGYRIYKGDENTLYAEITDPNTTQHFIETTAGSSPVVTNIMVSSINKLGVESPKTIPMQSQASVEAGAPAMPNTPPTYTDAGGFYSRGTFIQR